MVPITLGLDRVLDFGLAQDLRCRLRLGESNSMTTDPYRVAYESALAEVTEITAKFEQLRTRKGQIESLIAALQPIFAVEGAVALSQQALPEEKSQVAAAETPESQEEPNYSFLDVPNPLPDGDGDPFQRRVKTSFRFRGLAAQRS